MITIYTYSKNKLNARKFNLGDPWPRNILWVDVLKPTPEEEKFVENKLDINAPNRQEIDKYEVYSPFYREANASYMTFTIMGNNSENRPVSDANTLILTDSTLISVRFAENPSYNSFINRNTLKTSFNSAEGIYEGLVEVILHNIADILEKTGNILDKMLMDVFGKSPTEKMKDKNSSNYYNEIIKDIGHTGNLISKNRESLVSINRMMIFYGQQEKFQRSKKNQRLRLKNIMRELHSLTEYVTFLAQRNSFLLDATLGMISVEQNAIIKVFTMAAAAFMPPTLIASIYGMNFPNIPEISWTLGYPFALFLIIISALLPFYFFKKKGWL